VLTKVDGISPIDSNGHLNTGWVSQLKREVYNVLPYDRVVNTGDGQFDSFLAGLFVGTSSSVCSQTFAIQNYGFALLGQPATTDNCGDTSASLRAFANG
jgi:hypothetical protein